MSLGFLLGILLEPYECQKHFTPTSSASSPFRYEPIPYTSMMCCIRNIKDIRNRTTIGGATICVMGSVSTTSGLPLHTMLAPFQNRFETLLPTSEIFKYDTDTGFKLFCLKGSSFKTLIFLSLGFLLGTLRMSETLYANILSFVSLPI